ncbi:MAG: hypothetical protein NUV75_01840 [Gallionella sp.]|nr:hypothetical protein [Gallionella sp.]
MPMPVGPAQAVLSDEDDRWVSEKLSKWARWMRRADEIVGTGYLKRSPGLHGFTHDGRGDKDYDKLDGWIAEAVDSCMASLSLAEWAAVQNHWHLAVFKFPRGNQFSLYLSAKVRLIPMLRRRNVV